VYAVVEELTNRELQILTLIASGKTTKQIARSLGISFKTAVSHRYSAQAKLGAKNAADMICRAFRYGLIEGRPEAPRTPAPTQLSDIFAIQSKVREDLRAGLIASLQLRRRSSQLLEELQAARAEMHSLVSELREVAKANKQPINRPVSPLTGEPIRSKLSAVPSGVARRRMGG
jgi:DNA-binding CsgD family transcriptional regulator